MPRIKFDRASIFMRAGWVGLAGQALFVASDFFEPEWLSSVGILLLIFGSLTLFFTRKADEYTEGLWNAGASVACGAMFLGFLGLPFAEGFVDGLFELKSERDIEANVLVIVQISAFYIGLFAKRLLGGG